MKFFKPPDFPKISLRKGVRKTRLNECAILNRARHTSPASTAASAATKSPPSNSTKSPASPANSLRTVREVTVQLSPFAERKTTLISRTVRTTESSSRPPEWFGRKLILAMQEIICSASSKSSCSQFDGAFQWWFRHSRIRLLSAIVGRRDASECEMQFVATASLSPNPAAIVMRRIVCGTGVRCQQLADSDSFCTPRFGPLDCED